MALVRPLKNNETDEYEEPIDHAVDGLAARGFYPQQAGTLDEAIGVERGTMRCRPVSNPDEESASLYVEEVSV